MSWRVAKSLVRLREQVNALYPNRDKASDGSIGDTAHRNRGKSDHNPNGFGVVTAIDIDEDLAPGVTVAGIVAQIQKSRDRRVKYIIYEGKITIKGDITLWKPYLGPNPHELHAHISVSADPARYDDASDWQISATTTTSGNPTATTTTDKPLDAPTTPAVSLPIKHPEIRYGVHGATVRVLQMLLNAKGFKVDVDGDFGRGTEKAVKEAQRRFKLDADGIVGPNTWKALGA